MNKSAHLFLSFFFNRFQKNYNTQIHIFTRHPYRMRTPKQVRPLNHSLPLLSSSQEFSDSGSLSSDDSDFNPDNLEALSAKEEYDSEPSTTSSEDDR